MEFQFQQSQCKESKIVKEASHKKLKSTKTKFVGVRQRPSGKWVAEIKNTTQKIRIWLGTFDTAEEAARAYDEAACLLRGSNTRTNFVNSPSSNDPNSALSRRIRNLVNHKRRLIINSQAAPMPIPPTTQPTDNVPNTSLVSFTGQTFDEKLMDACGQFDYSWAFSQTQFLPPIPDDLGMSTKQVSFTTTLTEAGIYSNNVVDEVAMLEFERMKVERQISASLYAMNGVNDYLHTVFNTYDSIDHDDLAAPSWDPPMLYHNFCLG